MFDMSKDKAYCSGKFVVYKNQINTLKLNHMLRTSITFLIIAIIAGLLGFTGIAGIATTIAKILFFVFLILFVFSLLTGRKRV